MQSFITARNLTRTLPLGATHAAIDEDRDDLQTDRCILSEGTQVPP
jgi:hypothetical protein